MLWEITELLRLFIGISSVKQKLSDLLGKPPSVSARLDVQKTVQDELQASVGQRDQQLIPGLHSSWRKCPEPPVPSTIRGPRDPQEETVHGGPAELGPRPGEPQHGAQS